jgi:hypothetical protein
MLFSPSKEFDGNADQKTNTDCHLSDLIFSEVCDYAPYDCADRHGNRATD